MGYIRTQHVMILINLKTYSWLDLLSLISFVFFLCHTPHILTDHWPKVAPSLLNIIDGPTASDNNLARLENEQHDRAVGWAVDKPWKHVFQVGAIHAMICHETIQVNSVAGSQFKIAVADDVLDTNVGNLKAIEREAVTQCVAELECREDALHVGLATREDHLPRSEKQHGAQRLA